MCDGACCIGDLKKCLGVSTQCGKCECQAQEILNENKGKEQ
jgi:bacterioferritin-associated ferredoxin